MIIRKTFKFEAAHMVRNCYTERCKKSWHGHSFLVDIFLRSNTLDNGGMVIDFSKIKELYNDFVDSFDHTYLYWNKESYEFKAAIHKFSDRWIELPISPSAESLALLFLNVLNSIIINTVFANGEKNIEAYAVRVHETATGYAEAQQEDLELVNYLLTDIKFSEAVIDDWKDPNWFFDLVHRNKSILQAPEHQIL